MKGWKTILVLVVVLVALGGLATWDERKTKEEAAAEKTKNRLATLAPNDVTELSFQSRATPPVAADAAEDGTPKEATPALSVKAKKVDGTWRLTEPVNALADQTTITNLLSTVTDYAYTKEIASSKDKWAEYGVAEPQRTVSLSTGGDSPKTYAIYLGNRAPVGFNLYFRTSLDDKVYMGSQHLLTALTKTLFDFRDKAFVSVEEPKLKSLTYVANASGNATRIELQKTDQGWNVVAPTSYQADADTVRAFVEELAASRAEAFVDQPSEALQTAFRKPAYQVSWQTDAGESTHLAFVEHEQKLYGTKLSSADVASVSSGTLYQLPDALKEKIGKDANAFRNRRILSLDSAELDSVSIDGETFKNVAGSWYATADAAKLDASGKFAGDPKDAPKEAIHVRTFVVDLEFARTDEFIGMTDERAKALGSAAPQHRVVLGYKDASKPQTTLELFADKASEARYYVRKSGADYVYLAPKAVFKSMKPGAEPDDAPAGEDDAGFDEEGLNLDMPAGEPPEDEGPTG